MISSIWSSAHFPKVRCWTPKSSTPWWAWSSSQILSLGSSERGNCCVWTTQHLYDHMDSETCRHAHMHMHNDARCISKYLMYLYVYEYDWICICKCIISILTAVTVKNRISYILESFILIVSRFLTVGFNLGRLSAFPLFSWTFEPRFSVGLGHAGFPC